MKNGDFGTVEEGMGLKQEFGLKNGYFWIGKKKKKV